MYLCWNSTSETSATRVTQAVEISKEAAMENEHAGAMMFTSQLRVAFTGNFKCYFVLGLQFLKTHVFVLGTKPLNLVPNSFETPTLLDPKAAGGPGNGNRPQRSTPKQPPASRPTAEPKKPPKAKTAEQQAKGVTWIS